MWLINYLIGPIHIEINVILCEISEIKPSVLFVFLISKRLTFWRTYFLYHHKQKNVCLERKLALRIFFSSILEITDKREMGLSFVGLVLDPFLNSVLNFAIIQSVGNLDDLIERLQM